MTTSRRATMGAALSLAGPLVLALAAQSKEAGTIPNFSDANMSWVKVGDDFIAPASGPGPVTFDKAHPYQPNNDKGLQVTYRVSDLTNPILKPWAIEQMKKTNDEVLAGYAPFRARSSCVPGGVPGFLIYGRLEPLYIVQTRNEVLLLNQADAQTRHIYMNVPHSAHPSLSWYGESVGHYEGGDTLVVDTIGMNDKTFVDDYRTPHTTELHVIERYKLMDGGKTLEVSFQVDDPGAYNMPWSGKQVYHLTNAGPILEAVCPENHGSFFSDPRHPMPEAAKPDF